jgi:hypothetical protein
MKADLTQAIAQGSTATPASEPAACKGLSQAQLEQLAGEVISEQTGIGQ